jgi:hypothetical protein
MKLVRRKGHPECSPLPEITTITCFTEASLFETGVSIVAILAGCFSLLLFRDALDLDNGYNP